MSNSIHFLLNPINVDEQLGGVNWAFPSSSSSYRHPSPSSAPSSSPPHPYPSSTTAKEIGLLSLPGCPSPLSSLSFTCAQVLDTGQYTTRTPSPPLTSSNHLPHPHQHHNNNKPLSSSIPLYKRESNKSPTSSSPPLPPSSLSSSSSSLSSASSSSSSSTASSSTSLSFLPISKGSNIGKKTEKKKGAMKEMLLEERYLRMKQSDAAFHLGFAATTFSKRWRASLPKRKWPFRKHVKLLNTIKDLRSMQQRGQDVQAYLAKLMREKKENLQPALVYYYEKDIVTRSRGYDEYDEEDEDEDGNEIDTSGERGPPTNSGGGGNSMVDSGDED